ncbi:MAG: hypothetical protein PHQ84_05405 [Candidatus Omnitrophica bacterium]|jgi:Spy/CpxP family protein refolding chaperone|nr:hypothetical protein [Candidatus Omnitrophota bacterium]MDD5078420.1 hypothetical protein [Candidatus Omnitrophota bacterium]
MNRNALYLALFAVLCVLAGVLTGAVISGGPVHKGRFLRKADFREKAERMMWYDRGKHRWIKGGPLQMFTEELELNAEQKDKVGQILEKGRQKIDEAGKDLRRTMLTIKESTDKQIMGLLTPQQQEKFNELQREFKQGRVPLPRGGHAPFPGGDLPCPPSER